MTMYVFIHSQKSNPDNILFIFNHVIFVFRETIVSNC